MTYYVSSGTLNPTLTHPQKFNLKVTHSLKIPELVVLKSAGLPNRPKKMRLLHKRCRYIRY